MANHVFGYSDFHMIFAVVNAESKPDHFRRNLAVTRPSFYNTGFFRSFSSYLLKKLLVNIWPFLCRTCHKKLSLVKTSLQMVAEKEKLRNLKQETVEP